jgi:hypothetical protein
MRIYFLFLIFLLAANVSAQDSTLLYHGTLLLGGSTEQTPLWISARQHGTIPYAGSFAMAAFGLTKRYHPNDPRRLQWSAKAEFIGNYHSKPDIFSTDLYVSGKWDMVEILVGQQKTTSGFLVDSTLSSGSLAMSGNARPFPKIQLSIPEFTPISFTNGYLSVKASYSDGLLRESGIIYGATRNVNRTFLHQKSLYFRLGNNDQKLKIYAGFNHQVIWGGEKEIDPLHKLSRSEAYKRVISGSKKDYKIIGNHFGTVDFGISWRQPTWTYSLYRQTIFENGSLFKVINYTDGLNGISFKRNKRSYAKYLSLNSAVVEVIGTYSQHNARPTYGLGILEYGNYFNHYMYQNGWSYRGINMGTPLVQAGTNLNESLPRNDNYFTNNNRLWALHSALNASWNTLDITFKATHSMNYGTYLTPFQSVKHQTALFLAAEKKVTFLGGSLLSTGISADVGSLLPHSYGLVIGLKKYGFLN